MFIFLSVALAVGGYIWYRQNQCLEKTTLRTTGRVVNLQQDRDKDQDGRPQLFRFAPIGFTAGGQSYQFRDPASVNPKIYAVSTTHPVLYNPQKPGDARLARG